MGKSSASRKVTILVNWGLAVFLFFSCRILLTCFQFPLWVVQFLNGSSLPAFLADISGVFLKPLSILLIAVLLTILFVSPSPTLAQSGFQCSDTMDVPQTECEALVALYNSTNGPSWTNGTNWLTGTTVDP